MGITNAFIHVFPHLVQLQAQRWMFVLRLVERKRGAVCHTPPHCLMFQNVVSLVWEQTNTQTLILVIYRAETPAYRFNVCVVCKYINKCLIRNITALSAVVFAHSVFCFILETLQITLDYLNTFVLDVDHI